MSLIRSPVLSLGSGTGCLLQLPLYLHDHVPQCSLTLYPKSHNLPIPVVQSRVACTMPSDGTLSDQAQASGPVKAEEACVYHRKGAATAPFQRTQAQASKKQELRCLLCPQPKANRECSPTINDQAKEDCRHEDRACANEGREGCLAGSIECSSSTINSWRKSTTAPTAAYLAAAADLPPLLWGTTPGCH